MQNELSSSTLAGFQEVPEDLQLLVIGDVMVDHYVYGTVERISPEAPVPVMDVVSSKMCPGGAANVAENLLALGAEVTLVGRVGRDADAEFLRGHFKGRAKLLLVPFAGYCTERKTRYMTSMAQLLRVDHVSLAKSYDLCDHAKLTEACEEALSLGGNGIVVSDYDKGTVDGRVAELVRYDKSKRRCYLDCKPATWPLWKMQDGGPLSLKPNLREFEAMGGRLTDDGYLRDPKHFNRASGADELLLTCGSEGMILVYNQLVEQLRMPSVAQEVYNVIGAGDTALAVYAWCRAGGMEAPCAALAANVASAESVRHRETVSIARSRLAEAIEFHFQEAAA
jgi:D-beta-D-heptose 7-phosphate kinase/D-beta-D-heptose 1-phosphate adenosyltransferase